MDGGEEAVEDPGLDQENDHNHEGEQMEQGSSEEG